jgi:hypothetical protein
VVITGGQWWAFYRNEVLGKVRTDKDGKYRVRFPRPDAHLTTRAVRVVATAPNYGLAWKALKPDAEQAEADLRLAPVQRVSGHIVGLQGEGAAGVTIHVARITRKPAPGERDEDAALRPPAGLPLSATTDANGNFVFRGFGPDVTLELEVLDPRYERKEEWFVNTADKKQCENIRLLLAPGRYVEGRVIYQDTGKPVPHARLMLANPIIETKADAGGRFKVPLFAPRDGEPFPFYPRDVRIVAFPPRGEPYQAAAQGVDFPRGVVRRGEVELALPRCLSLGGKVTEAGSGKPVAGAYVAYNGDFENSVASGPDGSFRIGVPAGAGRLMVTHPSGEYIPQVVGSAGGSLDQPVGDPTYYHAVVEVDVKKDEGKEVAITLRRGVTVQGRLIGPDGKPVASALMFVGGHRPRFENTMHPVLVRDGRFELRGLDPGKTYRALFLEHPNALRPMMTLEGKGSLGQLWTPELLNVQKRLGAAVDVSPKKAGAGPVVVRMAPCGSAKLRFVNDQGKPLAGYRPWLQLAVTPGLAYPKAIEKKALAAEVITIAYGIHQESPPIDADGYITFTGLIPGATYRLKQVVPRSNTIKDFTVEAGKTLEQEVIVK